MKEHQNPESIVHYENSLQGRPKSKIRSDSGILVKWGHRKNPNKHQGRMMPRT